MGNVQHAQRILHNYFQLAARGAWKWDDEQGAEIDAAVDMLWTKWMDEVDARIAAAIAPLLAQPAPPDVAAQDARAQRAELQLADARNAAADARNEFCWAREQMEIARRELADASDAHAAELGAAQAALKLAQIALENVTTERNEAERDRDDWRDSAHASARKVAAAREALDAE